MGFFIPPEREHKLREYKYSGHDGSLLSKYILTPYWNNLVKIFPMWYAPNLITLSGLAFVFVNFITMIYWEPLLACAPKPVHKALGGSWDPLFGNLPPVQEALKTAGGTIKSLWHGATFDAANKFCPPGWLFYSWGISLFIYQSLDAIDGKQARRTGASSPLGEVFDHGCDAINTTLEVLLTAAALNLGQGWWTVASQFFTLANFYLTTWEEYHTGTLYLSAFSGPVEGILMVCIIYMITGYYGPEFWDVGILTFLRLDHLPLVQSLHLKNLPLNECFLTFGFFALLFNIAGSYTNVYKARAKKGEDVFAPILGLLPFAINAGLNVYWLAGNEYIRTQHLLPFAVFWGLSFAYQVGLLITAHVTKGPFPYHNLLMFWSLVGAFDANAPKLFNRPSSFIQTSETSSLTFVYISLIVSFGVYSFFVRDTILTFCRVLDINCLTIKYYGKPKPATSFEKEPQVDDKKAAGNQTGRTGLRHRK